MKVTVVTGKDGALVAVAYGQAPQPDTKGDASPSGAFGAGLMAGPGQQLHVVDLADDVLQIGASAEFHQRVEAEFRKKRK